VNKKKAYRWYLKTEEEDEEEYFHDVFLLLLLAALALFILGSKTSLEQFLHDVVLVAALVIMILNPFKCRETPLLHRSEKDKGSV
jgi:hypothetical protein